jgi:hypothetical protein
LKSLLKRTISLWSSLIPILKQEKQIISSKQNLLVKRFTMKRLGRAVVKAWREETKVMRIEREKSEYKQKMWSKVNNWLADIDGNHHGAAATTPATLSTIGQDNNSIH